MPSPDNKNVNQSEKLWIAIGDIHDDVGKFASIPELDRASGIIISGDLTINGGVDKAKKTLDAIAAPGLPILAQIGNMDRPEVNVWLDENGINLHGAVRELTPEIAIFGIGGSTITPFGTPSEFSEADYTAWLEKEWQEAKDYSHTVLVSHNPPKDTLCDKINDKLHAGSSAVRAFIEKNQPEICICGHIHEGKARDRIGRTEIINPGTLANGGYVILRLKDGVLSVDSGQV